MKTLSSLAAALAARGRPLRPGRRLEAGHRVRRFEHRPGQRPCAPPTACCTSLGKKDGDIFHTAIAPDGKVGATTPIQTGLGGHERPGADRVVPGGLRAFWGGIRTTDADRAQPGPQHRVLLRRRRDVAAAARLDRPARRAGLRAATQRATTLPNGTTLQSWFGHARHVGARRARPGDAELQLPGRRRLRQRPQPRRRTRAARAMLAWFSDAPAAGILAQAVGADGAPGGRADDDARHAGDGRRTRRSRARRSSRGPRTAASTSPARVGYPTADQVRVWRVGAAFDDAAGQDRGQRRDARLDRRQGPPVGGLDGRRRSATSTCSPRARTRTRCASASRSTSARSRTAHSRVLARHQRDRVGRRRRAGACSASAPARTTSTYVTRVLPGPDAGAASARATASPSPSPTPATRSRARRSRPAASPARRTPRARSS